MEQQSGTARLFGVKQRRARIALSILLALKLTFLFIYALNSRFVMDEFGQLGYAKYLGNGLFDTVWPPKAVGFAVFYKLAHLVGWDAQSIVLAARLQTALLACGTIALVYGCARALGEDRVRALAIILVLLCFSNFIEQIFRARSEQLAVFFAVGALFVVVRGSARGACILLAAGVLSGLAFLATQKSVYFNIALGVALIGDAALARRYVDAMRRGAFLVVGWLVPILAYCLMFGGADFIPIAQNLVFGPVEVATRGGVEYGGLRRYVLQTLLRNAILYALCFAGLLLALRDIARLDERTRIALIFTIIITLLVFSHDQPWPYVFVMALPFMSLWSLRPLDRIAARTPNKRLIWAALSIIVATSFFKNVQYLRLDNGTQLELLARAESMIGPNEVYFDGIGMLPNRPEPTTLWLDRMYVLRTLQDGARSEAYGIFANAPPKIILWSYRMDAVEPVLAPLIRNSYVKVAPNLRLAGRALKLGRPVTFDVPVRGRYAVYSQKGEPLRAQVEIDGEVLDAPIQLTRGRKTVILRAGADSALLLPQGSYEGRFKQGPDQDLFAGVYD